MHKTSFINLHMKQRALIYFMLWIGLTLISTSHISAQDHEIATINKAFENSEWAKLSNYCQETICLSTQLSQGNYSKMQARYILADFFERNPVLKTKVIKSDKISEGFYFSILQSETTNKTFNIYYTIQEKKGTYLINEIHIKEKI